MANGATISALSNVLKYRYLGPLRGQLNDEVLMYQILGLDSKNIDLDGLKAVVPLRYARNTGVGARRENDTLPSAGNQAYQQAQFDLAYLYGTAAFSGPAIQKTKTDAGAFVRVITSEIDGLRRDLTLDTARQLYGDGTGSVGKVASIAGTTITLTSAEPILKGYFSINMSVDTAASLTPGAFSSQANAVTDVDPVAGTVTVTSAGTIAANDFIFRASSADASGTKEIPNGLQAMIATSATSVGGINAASAGNKWWANLFDTTGGSISLANLLKNWNKANLYGLKSSDAIVLTTPGITRQLFSTSDFTSNVRFVDTQNLTGGFEQLKFTAGSGTLTLVTDRLAPYGKVFMIDKTALQVYSPADWDYIDRDGLTVRQVPNQDAFQAYLFRYMNLGINRRNTSLVMSGLTDVGY